MRIYILSLLAMSLIAVNCGGGDAGSANSTQESQKSTLALVQEKGFVQCGVS